MARECSIEAQALGMNDAEVAVLKEEIKKKSEALSDIQKLDAQIAENTDIIKNKHIEKNKSDYKIYQEKYRIVAELERSKNEKEEILNKTLDKKTKLKEKSKSEIESIKKNIKSYREKILDKKSIVKSDIENKLKESSARIDDLKKNRNEELQKISYDKFPKKQNRKGNLSKKYNDLISKERDNKNKLRADSKNRLDKFILDKNENIKKLNEKIQDIKNNLESTLKDVSTELEKEKESYKKSVESLNERKKIAKDDALKIRESLAQSISGNAALKKLRAQRNKVLNDINNELISDYQRYAKDEALGNISTIRRRALADKISKNPKLLRDILVNTGNLTKDSIYIKLNHSKLDFKSYLQKIGTDHEEIIRNPDLDLYDANSEDVKRVLDSLRTYINEKHLGIMGENYFKDDLEHVVNINADTLRKDLDAFENDVLSATDNNKLLNLFNEQSKRVEDERKRYPEAASASAIGEARLSKVGTERSLDDHFKEWKKRLDVGTPQEISFNKLPFKSHKDFMDFVQKYSGDDAISNYINFIDRSFLHQSVINDSFGGPIFWSTVDKRAFDSKFTLEDAQLFMQQFRGGYEFQSTKMFKFLKKLREFKSIVMTSKAIKLPFLTVADSSSRTALEYIKNNRVNFSSLTMNGMNSLIRGWTQDIEGTARVVVGITKPMVEVLKKQHLNKLEEMVEGYHEYNDVMMVKDIENVTNPIFRMLAKFNNKFTYNPMHGGDNALRYGAWKAMTQTLKYYDPSKPIKLTERLDKLGITNDDIDQIQKYIKDSGLSAINIEDIEGSELRRKLQSLKYTTDMSAVPLDITPKALIKFTNAPLRIIATHFWNYTIKSTAQVWDTLAREDGWNNKIGAFTYYMLSSLPSNLAISFLLNSLYSWSKGQSILSSDNIERSIGGGIMGPLNRPAMILWALLSNNKEDVASQLMNPITSALTNVGGAIKTGAETIWDSTLGDNYRLTKDYQYLLNHAVNAILKFVPASDLGKQIFNGLTY